jgi:hypothetical protein
LKIKRIIEEVMTLKTIRIGALENVFQFDDGDFAEGIETDMPIKAGTPADPTDALRKMDIGSTVGDVLGSASSTNSNIAEFDGITGKKIKDGGLSHADISAVISAIAAGDTGSFTTVSAIQAGGSGTIGFQYKTRTVTVSSGIITSIGTESSWNDV